MTVPPAHREGRGAVSRLFGPRTSDGGPLMGGLLCTKGNRTVNKNDLIAAVADNAELTRSKAGDAVDAVLTAITAALKRKDEVRLAGFGTFVAAERKASTGRNPRTGEEMQIPASTTERFKVGKGLKDTVN